MIGFQYLCGALADDDACAMVFAGFITTAA